MTAAVVPERTVTGRKASMAFRYIPFRTRRALLLYKVNRVSALLVLNGTSVDMFYTPLWLSTDEIGSIT